ncbi:Hint domain-containing protein [Bradyrhizobium sp. 76]|uniref:Hint domain-containing protein n=1 Tax=Bradyrhizobium sp. 76 TaxID=2782680 RepID=UPI001FF7F934|nr:Hint domain-containing protein [Bradyrhizobium sp. 76]MCK1405118.1 Hint domain-containing protein [Bradyrhizobium sp. 76]
MGGSKRVSRKASFTANVSLSSLDGTTGFKLSGVAAGDQSGTSVASAGDINNDGFDDIIIGAPLSDPNGQISSGASYVVFGKISFASTPNINLSSLDGTAGFTLNGTGVSGQSGFSVASAGDVNNDGFDDIIVGAPRYNGSQGMSYLIYGHASFAAAINLTSISGTAAGYQFTSAITGSRSGYSVAAAGDVNGDGYGDFIVGGPFNDASGLQVGASYVVFGQAGALSSSLNGTNGFIFGVGGASNDNSGYSVASAGDVNGDGFDDLIIGARNRDSTATDSGTSYVLFGHAGAFTAKLGPSSIDGTNGFSLTGAAAGDQVGSSVASAGDLNGDGFDDLIVGAPGTDFNGSASGSSYVLYGRAPDAAVTRIGSAADQTIRGGAFDDTLYGLGGDDQLFGQDGYDNLYGGSGNDKLNGGNGDDTAHFTGARSDYIVTQLADGSLTIADQRAGAPDGTDTVVNVEFFKFSDAAYTAEQVVACYCTGTLILTDGGEVRVEDLAVGDQVITMSGNARAIKWIGRRSYAGRFLIGQKHILPIRINAGAIDENVPKRDLWISPHHAMYLQCALIEARDLVNGVSIVQPVDTDKVEYFHIELDTHDVIIAEGSLSETFIDDDSRGIFDNAHEYSLLYTEEHRDEVRYCAPRRDCGNEVEAARERIESRAGLRTHRNTCHFSARQC